MTHMVGTAHAGRGELTIRYPCELRALTASWWLVCVVRPMMGHRLPRVQFMYMMRSSPMKRVMLAAAGSVVRFLSAGHAC